VKPIWPGATIGVLGGGQLARMLALEARRMGYRIAVLDPDPAGPAAPLADVFVPGAFDDLDAAQTLARHSDVVTIDTEHIPAEILERLESTAPVRPSAAVLRTVQDRLVQRRFLGEALGAPQVEYAPVEDLAGLRAAVETVGVPAVLKTRRSGYDGKGQARISGPDDVEVAWAAIGRKPAVLETFVEFEREISVLLARDVEGRVAYYPIAENEHRRHILYKTRIPARLGDAQAAAARELGGRIADALGHVGMIAIELFVTHDGGLLVNEIAPRTHNSGHFTFGACATSQFDQHARAICGLALGDPTLLRPAVMLNLLGDLWAGGAPAWSSVFSRPNAHLHLYGKSRVRAGRKMGHVLVLADDADEADADAEAIASELTTLRSGS
jgi:5-(carboxyamino)imidazole ribonucleotide synthase